MPNGRVGFKVAMMKLGECLLDLCRFQNSRDGAHQMWVP